MTLLSGKTAIVTGAASGIGRATALRMAECGAAVVLADIDADGLREVEESINADGGRGLAVPTDVGDEAQIRTLVDRAVDAFGPVRVLHNNAAALGVSSLGKDGNLEAMTSELWDSCFAVNLRSQMLCAKYTVPHMLAAGGGSIINMSSGASLAGDVVRLAYSAAKAGVNALTRSIATMYGKEGIRCNAVAPGFVLSPPARAQVPERHLRMYEDNCLTPFLGEPEDIAEVVVFLASDGARYLTGQVISVDGGSLSHLGTVPKRREQAG
jgi:NAD(P)-dependent dehydrogenase (short-subunit alcohol dehydrogenase family)